MISIAYVNGETATLYASDPFISIEKAINESELEIEEAVSKYIDLQENFIFEAGILGTIDEEKSLFLEAEGDNVFAKIGDAVIAIFKKIQEVIKNVISSIKNLGFKYKSYDDKINALCKGDPSLRDDVIAKFSEAELSITDIKSLKEFQEAYDELVKLSKQKDIDPKSFKGRVEAFKKKFENIDKSAVVKTAGAVTAVLTAAGAAFVFKKHVLDVQKTTRELEKISKESYDQLLDTYEVLKKKDGGKYVDPDSLTKAQIDQNLFNFYQGKVSAMVSRDNKSNGKIASAIESFIKKHDNAAEHVSNLNKDAKEHQSRKAKAQRDEVNKKKREAAASARASELARLRTKSKWDNDHPKDENEELDKEYRKAMAQQQGREAGTSLDHARDLAQSQQEGREAGTTPKTPGVQKIEIVNNSNPKNNGKNKHNKK
jgi:hypothetical protein